MYVTFDQMPTTARIWIYQSKNPFSEEIQTVLPTQLEDFAAHWQAHAQPLKASFALLHGHFLVLAVDESFNQTSGCSIDASVHFLQDLEKNLPIQLFDRLHHAVIIESKIAFMTQKQIKEAIATEIFDKNTLVFNNLIQNVGDLENNWQIPAEKSWLGKYFQVAAF
jgi:hypothetical protein